MPTDDIGLLVSIDVTSICGVLVVRNERGFHVHVLIATSFIFVVSFGFIFFLLARCFSNTRALP